MFYCYAMNKGLFSFQIIIIKSYIHFYIMSLHFTFYWTEKKPSPIQVLTLLSDNSTHWAAVMLQECSEQNSICPCLSLPAGLLDRETVPHPSTLQTAFMCFRLSDSHQDCSNLRKNKVHKALCKDPGGSFRWAISVLEASMVRSIVQISRC